MDWLILSTENDGKIKILELEKDDISGKQTKYSIGLFSILILSGWGIYSVFQKQTQITVNFHLKLIIVLTSAYLISIGLLFFFHYILSCRSKSLVSNSVNYTRVKNWFFETASLNLIPGAIIFLLFLVGSVLMFLVKQIGLDADIEYILLVQIPIISTFIIVLFVIWNRLISFREIKSIVSCGIITIIIFIFLSQTQIYSTFTTDQDVYLRSSDDVILLRYSLHSIELNESYPPRNYHAIVSGNFTDNSGLNFISNDSIRVSLHQTTPREFTGIIFTNQTKGGLYLSYCFEQLGQELDKGNFLSLPPIKYFQVI